MTSNKKVRVAALSVTSNTILIILKVIAGILSGSVSIISEAIHSSMDLVASIIAFFSVRISSKPADKDHPYGHGKFENVSGVIEGLLIFIAAFLIILEAVKKLFEQTEMSQTWVGIAVMVISAVINTFVSKKLYKVAIEEDSVALEADALHLKTDVYTSLGVGIGLLLLNITGIKLLDSLVAIAVACMIIKEAWELCSNAFRPLLDESLSKNDEEKIAEVLEKYKDEIIDYHKMRTRKSGNIKFIDFHMTVRGNITVEESHELSERIQIDIESEVKQSDIRIHIEPQKNNEGTITV